MKNNLSTTGLSMSQAQSISNLCNQSAIEIARKIASFNNYSKVFSHEGKDYVYQEAKPITEDIEKLILAKAKYHACQAYLMENIKAKDVLILSTKLETFVYNIESPVMDELIQFTPKQQVDEKWGWDQLSINEITEYRNMEALASHIGQFIHANGKLTSLRDELNTISPVSFIELKKGEQTPVSLKIHHDSKDLLTLHTSLAAKHRDAEARVNYFKAKVKNLVSLENARISQENAVERERVEVLNAEIRNKYYKAQSEYNEAYKAASDKFEAERSMKIKEISALRISIDPSIQSVIDEFLPKEN